MFNISTTPQQIFGGTIFSQATIVALRCVQLCAHRIRRSFGCIGVFKEGLSKFVLCVSTARRE
jgi:hypothetical protein